MKTEPKRVKTSLNFDPVLYARLKIIADQNNMPLYLIVENAVKRGLDFDLYTEGLNSVQSLLENQKRSFQKDKKQIESLIDDAGRIFRSYESILKGIHDGNLLGNFSALLNELVQESIISRLSVSGKAMTRLNFAFNILAKALFNNDEKFAAYIKSIKEAEKEFYSRKTPWGECPKCKNSRFWKSISTGQTSCYNCNPPREANDIAEIREKGEITRT